MTITRLVTHGDRVTIGTDMMRLLANARATYPLHVERDVLCVAGQMWRVGGIYAETP